MEEPSHRIKLFDEVPVLENGALLLRGLEDRDADALGALARSERVYRYLPTFLFEQKYADPREVIRRLDAECFYTERIADPRRVSEGQGALLRPRGVLRL